MAASTSIKSLLLDIEGTICPISYVKDVLYPYAHQAVLEQVPTLRQFFPISTSSSGASDQQEALLGYLRKFPAEVTDSPEDLIKHITSLIDRDIKDPALKALQGHLWKTGYDSGEIKAPLFKDVVPAIKDYSKSLSNGVSIYSSGSVQAQILLFKHVLSPEGTSEDITPFLTSYFDTVNAGGKTFAKSYDVIAAELKLAPESILFLSDNPLEIDAAVEAGYKAYLTVRPGNAPVSDANIAEKNYKVITTLENLI